MRTSHRLRLILTLAFAAILAVVMYAGYVSFWTDSEIWGTVAIRHWIGGDGLYDFYGKPLFSLVLLFNHGLSALLKTHPIYTGRLLFALNCLLMVYLFQRLALKLSHKLFFAFALTALTISNSFFIKRIGEVRSDGLITTMVLAWWLASTTRWWSNRRAYQRILFSLGAVLLCMAATPKSLIFTSPWLALSEAPRLRAVLRGRSAAFKAKVAGAAALVFILSALTISRSIRFFMESVAPGGEELAYFDLHRLEHLLRMMKENPWILLFWAFNIHHSAVHRGQRSEVSRRFSDFANLSLLALLIYPDRLPFLIASLIPFWTIPLAAAWPSWQADPRLVRVPVSRVLGLVIGFAAVNAVAWSLFMIRLHNNTDQKRFIEWIADSKSRFGIVNIYDPVGVAPFTGAQHWFVGPGESANNRALSQQLQIYKPEVVFYTTKMLWLGDDMRKFLAENYWSDGAGIFIHKHRFRVNSQNIDFELLKKQIYLAIPFIAQDREHRFYIELQGSGGIDISRYGKWINGFDEEVSFKNSLSANEMDTYKTLVVPHGTVEILVLPVKIETPFSRNWMELFRFNSEI